jgi:hypothetical protein
VSISSEHRIFSGSPDREFRIYDVPKNTRWVGTFIQTSVAFSVTNTIDEIGYGTTRTYAPGSLGPYRAWMVKGLTQQQSLMIDGCFWAEVVPSAAIAGTAGNPEWHADNSTEITQLSKLVANKELMHFYDSDKWAQLKL